MILRLVAARLFASKQCEGMTMSEVAVEQRAAGISIVYHDRAIQRQVLFVSTNQRFRTHIHPLNAPGTECAITRLRPVDHPWQYGVFFGLNDVNGYNFWCCGDAVYPPEIMGSMRHRPPAEIQADGHAVEISVVNDWLRPDGRPLLEERQTIHVSAQDFENSYSVDLTWRLSASHGDIQIGASDYGGLAARLVGVRDTKRHWNSEGRSGDDCAEQPARWVSVAQPVDGMGTWSRETRDSYAYAGLAIFDHPDNFRFPNRWRVDRDGMINPAPALAGGLSIPSGSALSLRYRLFVFTGAGDPTQIEDAYSTWSAQ
jgi:Family of unknown function (DUF6807)